jgi:ribosome-associated translation inhibitor RaiA
MEAQAEHLDGIARERFAAITAQGEQHRQRLDQEEIVALAAIRSRAAALAEELAAHRAAAEAAESAAADALAARLANLRDEAERIDGEIAAAESAALSAWTERAAGHTASLHEALAALDSDQRQVIEAGAARFRRFTTDAEALVARLREQMDVLDGELARRRVAGEEATRDAVAAIDLHLADLERSVAQHQERQLLRGREVAAQCAAMDERVSAFAETIARAGNHGEAARRKIEEAIGALETQLLASREALAGTDREVAALTDASVRLLEIIQAGSDHTRTHLPQALGAAEHSLKGMEERVFLLRDTLGDASNSGQLLSGYLVQTRQDVGAAMGELKQLQEEAGERTREQHHRIISLREALVSVRGETHALAGEVQGTLESSLQRLTAAALEAGQSLGSGAEGRIADLAGQLREAGSAAVAQVIEEEAAQLASGIESAVARAAETGREAARQLRDQLARVDELAGNLESRIARARERAEEQVDNDFARRVALISESLNSNAIDIVKVLSTEVTDTAWAAYLRGDRGIFTRRAVSLLDSTEAKAVLHHYERDREFQTHVNHFIHDFEAMLRQLLSTRDGNALGVTLLSSDMGKLYVALAQAIKRLRA